MMVIERFSGDLNHKVYVLLSISFGILVFINTFFPLSNSRTTNHFQIWGELESKNSVCIGVRECFPEDYRNQKFEKSVALAVIGKVSTFRFKEVFSRWNREVLKAVNGTKFVIFVDTDNNKAFESFLSKDLATAPKIFQPDKPLYAKGARIQWERSLRVRLLFSWYEQYHGVRFDIVVKLRPDLFFFSPLPRLATIKIESSTILAPFDFVRGKYFHDYNFSANKRAGKAGRHGCAHASTSSAAPFDCMTFDHRLAVMGRSAAEIFFNMQDSFVPHALCFVFGESEVNITSAFLLHGREIVPLETRYDIARDIRGCNRNSPCALEKMANMKNKRVGLHPLPCKKSQVRKFLHN
mmetsp:Transcript_11063/g.31313  ORF Transcript_11063/g.31313 Transcript_11063/m.31313 type:complete len:352 (+) Transcript_11063:461-1516(+)